MSTQRIKMLERQCRIAVDNALAARKRLAAAVEAEGDAFVRPFLTLEEHSRITRKLRKQMRADHENQMVSLTQFLTNPEGHPHAKTYRRMAQLAVSGDDDRDPHQRRREELRVIATDAKDDDPHVVTAREILAAGKRRRGETED